MTARWERRARARRRMTPRGVLLALCGAIVVTGVTGASAHPTRQVIANGGAPASGSGRVLRGTVGQPIIGSSRGPVAILDHGWWAAGGSVATGVALGPLDPRALADRAVVGAPSPNPSRGVVRFALDLANDGPVSITVYDVRGREISRVPERALAAGRHSIEWTRPGGAASGIYFARVSAAGRTVGVRRFLLVD